MKQRYAALSAAAVLLAAFQLASPPPAAAQQQLAAPIVVVIDVQRILRESLAAQSVRGQLEDRRTSLRGEFSGLEKDLRDAEQALARQKAVLSEEAFHAKRQQYERRVVEAQQKFEDSRRDLDQAFQQALKEIQVGMLQVAEGVAVEMDADLVLAKSQVMFVNTDLDITDQVITRLDKQLPSVKVPAPKASGPAPALQPPAE